MRKITALVKKGWRVEIISDSQGWFQVAFSHNTWGEAECGYGERLTLAIDEAYKHALELEQIYSY